MVIIYLDGGFLQSQLSGQFAPSRPGHVILLQEFFLETSQLFAGESGAVTSHRRLIDAGRSS